MSSQQLAAILSARPSSSYPSGAVSLERGHRGISQFASSAPERRTAVPPRGQRARTCCWCARSRQGRVLLGQLPEPGQLQRWPSQGSCHQPCCDPGPELQPAADLQPAAALRAGPPAGPPCDAQAHHHRLPAQHHQHAAASAFGLLLSSGGSDGGGDPHCRLRFIAGTAPPSAPSTPSACSTCIGVRPAARIQRRRPASAAALQGQHHHQLPASR